MAYAMTKNYSVFRKTTTEKILWVFDHNVIDEELVEIPKHHEDDYEEKCMRYYKESISLVDRGYTNGRFTDEVIENIRQKILKHQIKRNEVWE
jgi:hypothetical protein